MTTCDPIGTSGLQGEAMAMRTVRMRGMEPPYAQDQIAAFVLHPVISAVSSVWDSGQLMFGLPSSFPKTLVTLER